MIRNFSVKLACASALHCCAAGEASVLNFTVVSYSIISSTAAHAVGLTPTLAMQGLLAATLQHQGSLCTIKILTHVDLQCKPKDSDHLRQKVSASMCHITSASPCAEFELHGSHNWKCDYEYTLFDVALLFAFCASGQAGSCSVSISEGCASVHLPNMSLCQPDSVCSPHTDFICKPKRSGLLLNDFSCSLCLNCTGCLPQKFTIGLIASGTCNPNVVATGSLALPFLKLFNVCNWKCDLQSISPACIQLKLGFGSSRCPSRTGRRGDKGRLRQHQAGRLSRGWSMAAGSG